MVITGEEFSMTGEAIASPVNMLKYALVIGGVKESKIEKSIISFSTSAFLP